LAESPRPLSDTKKLASPLVPYIAAWKSTHHQSRVAALGRRCLSGPLRLSSTVFNLFPSPQILRLRKSQRQLQAELVFFGPIINIYRTCHPTLSGGPNPSNNSEVYNLFALA
jgi:hypothetical protein